MENLKRIEEDEAEIDYATKYILNKEENEELDKQIMKDRLKDKHIKKKQQKRAKEFERVHGAGGEKVAVLGGGDDDEMESED